MSKEDEINRILSSQMGSINSAEAYSRAHVAAERIVEERSKQEQAIIRTAQNSQAQVGLLKGQLNELRFQNEFLFDSNRKLKELYNQVKQEAESSKKEAKQSYKATKKSNRLSILAIAISLMFSIASILVSLLINI